MGYISDQKVVILIDGGSTHNFVYEQLVFSLGLLAQPTYLLHVMEGNGSEIEYMQVYGRAIVQVHGHAF